MLRRLVPLALLVLAGCTASAPPPPPAPPAPKPVFGNWGVDLAGMDQSVKPGDDFFLYVNGSWYKSAVIPPDRSSIGSFQELQILSEQRMRAILSELEAKPYDSLSPEQRKLRDFYGAFMDTKEIEDRGLEPVKADLALIAGLKKRADVARVMGSIRMGIDTIYDLRIGVDDKHPTAYSVNLRASGLGLSDRDYYLLDDPDLVSARQAYEAYIAKMFTLAGVADAAPRAAKVVALETEIAKAHWERKDRRNRDKTYNPMSYAELKRLAPKFPWDAYFADSGIPLQDGKRQVIVAEKSAFPVLAEIFARTPVAVWRDYLTAHYLETYAEYLPKAFDDANFAFYGTVIGGRKQQLERETRAVHLIDAEMGFALGKLYVERYFPPATKAKAEALVANLLKAYEADIKTLDWMGEATRQKALAKLTAFKPKIGYPSEWRDYSNYAVERHDLVGDVQRGGVFEWKRKLARLDQPVDRTEWRMTPPTVNANYSAVFNDIEFPAAILQPPFFDPNADDAVNYGGIGVVIGHEISHGFDDQGSKYAGDGTLENWWTDEDRKNFEARTRMLVAQYDAYEPLPGKHIRGAATLGENIADLAGLTIALKAYHISLDGKPAPVLDGFTGDQRLFMGLAQVWRVKYTDGNLRDRVLSDPHSPGMFRVRGMTRNVETWYGAFGVKSGDKYYLPPEERVRLW